MRAPRQFRARRVLPGLAGVALLLSACAVFHFQAPNVTPTAVELMDVALDQQRFNVALHVQNPNERALPIKWVHVVEDFLHAQSSFRLYRCLRW